MTGALIGERVLVMVSGLEALGVPASDFVSTSATVIDVDAASESLTVHLDVGFGGQNIVSVERERVSLLHKRTRDSEVTGRSFS